MVARDKCLQGVSVRVRRCVCVCECVCMCMCVQCNKCACASATAINTSSYCNICVWCRQRYGLHPCSSCERRPKFQCSTTVHMLRCRRYFPYLQSMCSQALSPVADRPVSHLDYVYTLATCGSCVAVSITCIHVIMMTTLPVFRPRIPYTCSASVNTAFYPLSIAPLLSDLCAIDSHRL